MAISLDNWHSASKNKFIVIDVVRYWKCLYSTIRTLQVAMTCKMNYKPSHRWFISVFVVDLDCSFIFFCTRIYFWEMFNGATFFENAKNQTQVKIHALESIDFTDLFLAKKKVCDPKCFDLILYIFSVWVVVCVCYHCRSERNIERKIWWKWLRIETE